MPNRVITATKQCELAISHLVACAGVVVRRTIRSPACEQQLAEAAREVDRVVAAMVAECRLTWEDGTELREVTQAAADTLDAKRDVLKSVK